LDPSQVDEAHAYRADRLGFGLCTRINLLSKQEESLLESIGEPDDFENKLRRHLIENNIAAVTQDSSDYMALFNTQPEFGCTMWKPPENKNLLDWSKPIQFQNGELCELIETRPEGYSQFLPRSDGTYPTRLIHRVEIDQQSIAGLMSSYWYVHEDGKCNEDSIGKAAGYNIINRS
jgi:hypothetical protein